MPAKTKMLKQLSVAYMSRDTPSGGASTTLAAAAAAGATSISVASNTNLANGDTIRVGAGEEMELCVITGAITGAGPYSVPIGAGLVYAHASGEAVVEQTVYDLGDVNDGGFELNFSGEIQDVQVATRRLVLNTLTGYVNAEASFELPGFTLYNLAVALGIPFATVADPTTTSYFGLPTDGSDWSAEQNICVIGVGTLMDGTVVRAELWGCDMDYSGVSFALSRGQLTAVPVKFLSSAGGIVTTVAAPFSNISTAFRATKNDLYDAVAETGLFTDSGTPTTLSAAPAAGANTISIAASVAIANNDWIRIDSGADVEFHQVHSGGGTTSLTLKSKLLRAHANGAQVSEVALTPFSAVNSDGVAIDLGGSIEPLRVVTRRLSVGARPGPATIGVTLNLSDLTLANFAYVLGVPQADIAGGRLPVGSRVGTATDINGLYVRGTTKGGGTVWVNLWGVSQFLESFALAMSATGQPSIPLTARPSAIHFIRA